VGREREVSGAEHNDIADGAIELCFEHLRVYLVDSESRERRPKSIFIPGYFLVA
jgi:hypothetical protein